MRVSSGKSSRSPLDCGTVSTIGRDHMKLPRRRFLHLAAGAAALPMASRFVWAQAYPTRPITLGGSICRRRLLRRDRTGYYTAIERSPGPAGHRREGRRRRRYRRCQPRGARQVASAGVSRRLFTGGTRATRPCRHARSRCTEAAEPRAACGRARAIAWRASCAPRTDDRSASSLAGHPCLDHWRSRVPVRNREYRTPRVG